MIQDIAPHIYHNEYCPEKPDADSYLMYFERHNALARWDGVEIAFPRFRDFPEVKTELSENIIYLFTVDDVLRKLRLHLRKIPESGKCNLHPIPAGQRVMSLKIHQIAVCVRLLRAVFIVIDMRRNILYHIDSPL